MPDTTPLYGLPYPNDTDTLKVSVKDTPKALAQGIEAALSSMAGVAASATNPALASGTGTVRLYQRGFLGILVLDWTSSGAGLVALTSLATLPAGKRPPVDVPGTAVNFTTGATFSLLVTTGGGIQFRNPVGGVQRMLASVVIPL